MANMAADQPSSSAGLTLPLTSNTSFLILKHPKAPKKLQSSVEPIPIKQIKYKERIPRVVWNEAEVDRINIIENLQYTVMRNSQTGDLK
ncbi:hypothetical protein H5410_021402 [Solanum commersonii]|uniref:Uncharacterized protein n=1 Tax=Solanum commersonii TaxID=4109 RepID=A0A9J5ZB92_SOLCO|nr:hypothetical protein H5410_021402 [Solanum commersonii]